MIIDCHGHYTTAPQAHRDYRTALLGTTGDARRGRALPPAAISDDDIRATLTGAQLKVQAERGTDRTIFSPTASAMGHHDGDAVTSELWSRACNDLIHRVCALYPDNFTGVGQLPQSPGTDPAGVVPELRRCVEELGFVGVNLNPDPTGGHWTDRPITDRQWYPVYEAMTELDVPAMIHVSASDNPNLHTTSSHYLGADTAVFMQLLTSTLFRDFPTLRFVIPHGGGAVPYHWGRYRGLALDRGLGDLAELLLGNVFFDTCVYHQPGMRLLTEVIPAGNILFASETIGAVKAADPDTAVPFDHTRTYLDALPGLTPDDRARIYEHNARAVYPRLP